MSAARGFARRVLPDGSRSRLLGTAIRTAPLRFSLNYLGAFHGTDKVDRWHTHNGRTYCDIYDGYLGSWRKRRFTMLEIGVLHGASLRMWRDYFPRARVVGLDIDPDAPRRVPDFEVVVANQVDAAALNAFVDAHPDLALVVDDGGHYTELMIGSFEILFPRLPSGSLYVIEDIGNTYTESFRDPHGQTPADTRNDRAAFERFLAALVRDCDTGGEERAVAFVHSWPSMLVVGRA